MINEINDLNKLVFPLINRDTVASFTMKYSYSNKTNSLNRYFSLLGGYDPIVNFLKKNSELKKKLSKNGFQEYKNNFSERIVMNKFLTFFKEIIN